MVAVRRAIVRPRSTSACAMLAAPRSRAACAGKYGIWMKPARTPRRFRSQMQHRVGDVVADVGAGALGYLRRQARGMQRREHRLDRQRAEIGGRAIGDHWLVDRLRAGIVRDARILHVDGDPFQ